jgi:hypothetical protein
VRRIRRSYWKKHPPREEWERALREEYAAENRASLACAAMAETRKLAAMLPAVRIRVKMAKEMAWRCSAADLGVRVWLGGKSCKGGPAAPAYGG